ncbi:MAG: L,D-transpeptidase family protein [Candidatus Omnitrophota bacterium]
MKKVYIAIIAGVVGLGIIAGLFLTPKNKSDGDSALELAPLVKADKAFSNQQLLEAKALYKSAMESIEDAGKLKEVQAKIEEINTSIILSPIIDACSAEYEVKPGDALVKIARKFKTTVNLIKRANNLTSDTIRPAQLLKVNTCQFSIVVDKSQNLLFLKRKGEVIKTYTVSTGKDNSTPTGTFYINKDKLVNPTWYKTGAIIPPDSSENILGSRWMGLGGIDSAGVEMEGYGIHGTNQPNDLGKQITLGCVRMRNADVEEIFDIVPVGTEVIIID